MNALNLSLDTTPTQSHPQSPSSPVPPTDAIPEPMSITEALSSEEGVSLLRHRILTTVMSPSLLATYTHAVDELALALVSRQDKEMPRDVMDAMLWLWVVSDSLVPLLKSGSNGGGQGSSGDPGRNGDAMEGVVEEGRTEPAQEAVAIFAHFCILLKHHESHWWLQGWADHLIARAYEILDEEHRIWIEWPMREVGWSPAGGLRVG